MTKGVLALGLALAGWLCLAAPAAAEVSGGVAVAGNGPELSVIERLAQAFQKANPRAYVDIQWEKTVKPVELVKSGQAQVAVTGTPHPDLKATQIAWDGIAIMVNLSNHTKEVTKQQVADIFSGKIKYWSELGGPETRILLIDRPRQSNIRDTFERYFGLDGKIPDSTKVIGPDEKATRTVAGTLPPLSAVTYMSLQPALDAVKTGAAVRLLPIDKVEPEEPPVKDGRYQLRRPVLLLTGKEPTPSVEAFLAFALSPEGQKIVDEVYIPFSQKP
ncbi:MAG: substrate-binding domain-containing protein [Nitrospirota bacterium]